MHQTLHKVWLGDLPCEPMTQIPEAKAARVLDRSVDAAVQGLQATVHS